MQKLILENNFYQFSYFS